MIFCLDNRVHFNRDEECRANFLHTKGILPIIPPPPCQPDQNDKRTARSHEAQQPDALLPLEKKLKNARNNLDPLLRGLDGAEEIEPARGKEEQLLDPHKRGPEDIAEQNLDENQKRDACHENDQKQGLRVAEERKRPRKQTNHRILPFRASFPVFRKAILQNIDKREKLNCIFTRDKISSSDTYVKYEEIKYRSMIQIELAIQLISGYEVSRVLEFAC